MKKKDKRAQVQLSRLSEYLEGAITSKNGIFTLDMEEKIGSGKVRCISFNRCMIAMEFDILLHSDLYIPLDAIKTDTVYFLYCLEGDCYIQINDSKNTEKLAQLQTVALYSEKGSQSSVHIKKDTALIFNVIGIDRAKFEEEFDGGFHGLDGKLKLLLDSFQKRKEQLHIGRHNLRIAEQVKQLEDTKHGNPISSFLRFEGICNLILAHQIEQFFQDEKDSANATSLTKRELKKVSEVSDYIKNYPEVAHSIKSLCGKSGLSPNKLQEGFKFMHYRTVSDFIRNVRIEKAEQLIRDTDMNISEVVYSIGLTSRSYFCKIFKNKYHCSPKQYKNKASREAFVS